MEVIARSSTTDSKPRAIARPIDLKRVTDALLVVLFLLGIALPLLGMKFRAHGWDIAARGENRKMAAEPRIFHLADIGPVTNKARVLGLAHFPGEFKAYLGDHFGFRNLLIKAHGILMVEGLNTTSTHMVELGKDGWLYLANDGSIEDYRNLEPFTDIELTQWRQVLEKRQAFCAKMGIPYLFVVAPSKHDVYPEFMPDRLNRVREESRLDQLMAYLKRSGSPVEIVDLRLALAEARKSGVRLFHKTDTHWNDRGAWAAYQAIMQAVRAKVPGAKMLSSSDFAPGVSIDPGMDLARLLGLNDQLHEEALDLSANLHLRLPKVIQDDVNPITLEGDGPRVVVFRDSFLTSLLPWMAEGFGHGVYLWEDGFDTNLLKQEKPNLVIQEIAQRKLMQPAQALLLTQPVIWDHNKWRMLDSPPK